MASVSLCGDQRNGCFVVDADILAGISDREPLCDGNVAEESTKSTAREELIFRGICWVRLDLDRTVPSQGDNPLQSLSFERNNRKEEICKPMTPREHEINSLSVNAVAPAFLTSAEREAPPDDDVRWEQASGKNVGAQVHVMMPVDPLRACAVEPRVLLDLGGHQVRE